MSDMQDQLGGVVSGRPAMTSTPVTAGDLGKRNRKENLAPSRGEIEAPISPLSSTSPTGRENDPVPDPGLTTSAVSAAPGVDATDSSSAMQMDRVNSLGTGQVVGTNKGAEIPSSKRNDADTSLVVPVKETGDTKELKQEQVASGVDGKTPEGKTPEGMTMPGGVDTQATQMRFTPEGQSVHHKDNVQMEVAVPALATLEVSPPASSAPATLEVTPTVGERLEVVSPGLDTVGLATDMAKDTAVLSTDPQLLTSKPLEVETIMEVGRAAVEIGRATTEVGGATAEVGGATTEVGGATTVVGDATIEIGRSTSPLRTDPVVSPASVGEDSSRDNKGKAAMPGEGEHLTERLTEGEGEHPKETPDVLTEEVMQKLRKVACLRAGTFNVQNPIKTDFVVFLANAKAN